VAAAPNPSSPRTTNVDAYQRVAKGLDGFGSGGVRNAHQTEVGHSVDPFIDTLMVEVMTSREAREQLGH
jgi:hypothetical protein